jgi:hypothetical protein
MKTIYNASSKARSVREQKARQNDKSDNKMRRLTLPFQLSFITKISIDCWQRVTFGRPCDVECRQMSPVVFCFTFHSNQIKLNFPFFIDWQASLIIKRMNNVLMRVDDSCISHSIRKVKFNFISSKKEPTFLQSFIYRCHVIYIELANRIF